MPGRGGTKMFSFNTLRLYRLKALFVAIGSLSCVGVMQSPAEAATLHVPGQYSTIQAAINAANLGDTIIVEAGRTYTENLLLRYKSSGSGYITIQSSALANLPAAGNRVSPSDAVNMPKLQSADMTTPVIRTESGTNPSRNYRLIGLEIARRSGTGTYYNLIELGTTGSSQNTLAKVPFNFVIDRCYIHGTDGANTRRGLILSARDVEVVNSYFEKFHEIDADAQAILGWNAPGGHLIANNYLSAAGQNILYGGVTVSISGMVPTDVVIENNHFRNPTSWRTASWQTKYLFELKFGKNFLIQNNIFENAWSGTGGNGEALVFTPRAEGSSMPWSTIENIVFRYNIVRNVGNGMSLLSEDYSASSQVMKNIDLNNNLFVIAGGPMGGMGWSLLPNKGGSQIAENFSITHNTMIHPNGGRFMDFNFVGSAFINGLRVNDNLVAGAGDYLAEVAGNNRSGTNTLSTAAVNGAYEFNKNALRRSASGYPNTSFYPSSITAIGFENYSGGNYALRSDSPYKNAGTTGKDIGADIVGLNTRTACVESGRQSDCAAGSSVTAHDFDGDGKADISVFRPGNGVWYLNRSRDGFAGVGFGNSADIVAPGDFDGDGKADIAVFRPSTGIWYILNSSDWSATIRQFGMSGDIPVVADYDGDGRADIAVWRPSNGVWYRLNSSNGQFQGGQFGMLGDRPAVGDYDGDGRADLAVFRPSNGVWYLNRSTAGVYVVQFGQTTDRIAPADFTGDGRTDIAVWRPSNGTWYRLDQATGQMSAVQFGSPGDIPVPADYDGDGRADLTVFRPATGVWYLQKSSEGFAAMQFGSTGDIPPASALMQ